MCDIPFSVSALMASRSAVVSRDSAGVAESARDATTSAQVEEVAAAEKRDTAGTLEKQPIQGKITYTIKVLKKGKPLPSASHQAMKPLPSASHQASAGAAKRKREEAGEEEAEEELLERYSGAFTLLLHPMSHVLELVDRMWHVVDLRHCMWHVASS